MTNLLRAGKDISPHKETNCIEIFSALSKKESKNVKEILISISTLADFCIFNSETAIKRAIEVETTYFNQRNYDKWADTWMQELYIYWSVTNPHEHSELRGWKALSQMMKDLFEQSPEPVQLKQQKTDYKFRVSGNMAFVTFLEDGNASTRVLETSGGKWKLIRMGVVNSTAYEQHNKSLH